MQASHKPTQVMLSNPDDLWHLWLQNIKISLWIATIQFGSFYKCAYHFK